MSHHDDGDWDSELGEGLIEFVLDLGLGGWLALFVVLGGVTLLLWHFYG